MNVDNMKKSWGCIGNNNTNIFAVKLVVRYIKY